ncbi:hypothetical protein AMTR_s05592p00003000 [Amborella trichopoda]|uniref:Uncharacterized protein n=1 Tax=Amborella trichopoda TaxID=13333 RepID=U5CUU5_AMBTC|nr:hypothetical protein AMTR_s05592p00003000 [Amborella trichopoda]
MFRKLEQKNQMKIKDPERKSQAESILACQHHDSSIFISKEPGSLDFASDFGMTNAGLIPLRRHATKSIEEFELSTRQAVISIQYYGCQSQSPNGRSSGLSSYLQLSHSLTVKRCL